MRRRTFGNFGFRIADVKRHRAWGIGLEVGGALRFRLEAIFTGFVKFVASNL